MFSIADYDKRYKPTNKSGGELKNADYVKLPVKPKGDGLQTLLAHERGLEVFGIWCLLLEKTTDQKPEHRWKLSNFRDEAASIEEISQSISLKGQESLVEYAITLLVSMGWVLSTDGAEISSEEFRNRGHKLSKDKIREGKGSEPAELCSAFSLEQFVDRGVIAGLTEAEAEACYHHYSEQGWQFGNKIPITSVSAAVGRWRRNRPKFAEKNKETAADRIARLKAKGEL